MSRRCPIKNISVFLKEDRGEQIGLGGLVT